MQESVQKFAQFFSDIVLNPNYLSASTTVTPKVERQPADSLFS